MSNILFVFLFVLLMSLSVFFANLAFKKGKNVKKVLACQILSFVMFAGICSVTASLCTHAENTNTQGTVATEQASSKDSSGTGLGYLAMGIAIGLACLGTGLAVSSAASAAIGATSEEPKLFGKYLIVVALAEGVSIFGFLVSLFIYSKI